MSSYQQISAAARVRLQQEMWRMTQVVTHSAAIFEADASLKALAVGPDSDFSRLRVAYMDPADTSRPYELITQVGAPFVGRLDARLTDRIKGSKAPGRIVIAPDQRFEDNLALGFPSASFSSTVVFIRPKIDIVGHFTDPDQVPDKRSDRTFFGPVPLKNSGNNYIFFPFYGRRHFSVTTIPKSLIGLTAPPKIDIHGITFAKTQSLSTITEIVSPVDISTAEGTTKTVSVADDGHFDYLRINIETQDASDTFDGEDSSATDFFVSARASDREL